MRPISRTMLVLLGLALVTFAVPPAPAHPVVCVTTSGVPCVYLCEAGEMVWMGLQGGGSITFNGCGLNVTLTCATSCGRHIGYVTGGTATCTAFAIQGACEKAWMCPPTCGGPF